MKQSELLEIIDNIKQGKEYILNKEYSDMAYDLDIWNDGIHHFLDTDMPFDTSFDEFVCIDDETDEGKEREDLLESNDFQYEMLEWINKCLELAYKELELNRTSKNDLIEQNIIKINNEAMEQGDDAPYSFVSEDIAIHDPYMEQSGRFESDPILTYGVDYINWYNSLQDIELV